MTATPGITKSLAEKIADAHEILVIYTAPFLQDGNEKVTALRIQREFADATTMEPCGSYTTRVPEDDWDAVLSFLHDRATARLAALQDEARKALGVPEVSPPVAAPRFKPRDKVRVAQAEGLLHAGEIGHVKLVTQSACRPFYVVFDAGVGNYLADELELIPSPLSGDFISEADDARLVRVGRMFHERGLFMGQSYIGALDATQHVKAEKEGPGQGWVRAFTAKDSDRLTPEARLTLRTAEATLTADERAKVEAGE